jgi:hypothetical protein
MPENIGPLEDVAHRWTKRTHTLEWSNCTNEDFAKLDALVDYLGQRRGVVKAPWWPYQQMIGGGNGMVSLSGAHSAGDTTIAITGWTARTRVVDYGDFLQLGCSVPWPAPGARPGQSHGRHSCRDLTRCGAFRRSSARERS